MQEGGRQRLEGYNAVNRLPLSPQRERGSPWVAGVVLSLARAELMWVGSLPQRSERERQIYHLTPIVNNEYIVSPITKSLANGGV